MKGSHAAYAQKWLLLPALPIIALTFYIKYAVAEAKGFYLLSRFVEKAGPEALSPLERLSLFRGDLFNTTLVLPSCLLLAGMLIHNRTCLYWFVGVCLSILAIAMYIQLQVFYEVGTFVSGQMVESALQLVTVNPHELALYLHSDSAMKLIAVLIVIAMACRASYSFADMSPSAGLGMTKPAFALAALIFFNACFWFSTCTIPTTVFHKGVIALTISALTRTGGAYLEAAPALNTAALDREFAELTLSPASSAPSVYEGRAKGFDVIFFVYETLPAAVLPLEGDLADLPALAQLREHSIVALNHYTTAPYTNRALFSLFTSWYPSNDEQNFPQIIRGFQGPSIFRELRVKGYATALYLPDAPDSFENDGNTYRALGIERLVFPDQADFPPSDRPAEYTFQIKEQKDNASLETFLNDISGHIDAGKHYAVGFLPQLGHGGVPEAEELGSGDLYSRARRLRAKQDRSLARVVQLLQQKERLDRTVIVVTGDHGFRNAAEDKDFPTGKIASITFHVPFLLYVPGMSATTTWLKESTSHLDVAPTLYDLFGLSTAHLATQGMKLWDENLSRRRLFFFGKWYFGADGYLAQQRAMMLNEAFQLSYISDAGLQFEDSGALSPYSGGHAEIKQVLERMTALQQRWAWRFTTKYQS